MARDFFKILVILALHLSVIVFFTFMVQILWSWLQLLASIYDFTPNIHVFIPVFDFFRTEGIVLNQVGNSTSSPYFRKVPKNYENTRPHFQGLLVVSLTGHYIPPELNLEPPCAAPTKSTWWRPHRRTYWEAMKLSNLNSKHTCQEFKQRELIGITDPRSVLPTKAEILRKEEQSCTCWLGVPQTHSEHLSKHF
jgi:hypothetical protein